MCQKPTIPLVIPRTQGFVDEGGKFVLRIGHLLEWIVSKTIYFLVRLYGNSRDSQCRLKVIILIISGQGTKIYKIMDELLLKYQQAKLLTLANMKSRYRKTIVGFLWVMINPILVYGIQTYIFNRILRFKLDDYHLFMLGGVLPWIFVSQCLEMGTPLFVNSAPLLKSFKISPIVILSAQVFDNAINFALAFLIIFTGALFNSNGISKAVLLLPIPLILLFFGTFSFTWVLAILNVFYRDTRFVISFALNILFFLTPVFYPESVIPKEIGWMIYVNPLYYLIKPIRAAVYDYNTKLFLLACLNSLITVILSLCMATFVWRKFRNELYLKL